MTFHRWVSYHFAPDFIRCGWLALPSLEGTGHGDWSVHMIWLCQCPIPQPDKA